MFTVGDAVKFKEENKTVTREEYETLYPLRKGTKTVPVISTSAGVEHKAWGRKLVIRYSTYVKRAENYWGFCVNCGKSAAHSGNKCGLEPDARNYPCPACKRPKMMGYTEALLRNFVDVE